MVTHVSNEQLKGIIANAVDDNAAPRKPALVEGLNPCLHTEVALEWLRPPIPSATGWYWCLEGEPVNGPFNTIEAAYDDALEAVQDQLT